MHIVISTNKPVSAIKFPAFIKLQNSQAHVDLGLL